MKKGNYNRVFGTVAVLLALTVSPLFAAGSNSADLERDIQKGRNIFKSVCFICHGSTGEGDGGSAMFIGPYMHPRPNNFTMGVIKFRSTESGEMPTLKDLMRTIRIGIPGFMPSFRNLRGDGVRQVALYISRAFMEEELAEETTIAFLPDPYTNSPEVVAQAKAAIRLAREANESPNKFLSLKTVTFSAATMSEKIVPSKRGRLARGKKLFYAMQCVACHGVGGRGAKTNMKDERGLPVRAADLSRLETLGNGHQPEDIYRTIMTGLNGTPMPSFSDLFIGEEEKVWDLVYYVLSLQKREEASTF